MLSRGARIAVIGDGHAGLSLASAAVAASFSVNLFRADGEPLKAQAREAERLPLEIAIAPDAAVSTAGVKLGTSEGALPENDVICLCPPEDEGRAAPSNLETACRAVARGLRSGSLVIVVAGLSPGATGGPVRALLETSGLLAGRDFLLACSPDRTDTLTKPSGSWELPRVVGGLTPEATGLAALFYRQLVDQVVVVSSSKAAELVQLLSDASGQVNAALVNEMAMVSREAGVDVWEVVEAASTGQSGSPRLDPGLVDTDAASLELRYATSNRDGGSPRLRILEQAREINARMGEYIASRIADALNDAGKAVKGASILILGVSSVTGPSGRSATIGVMNKLSRQGARVSYHDPHVRALSLDGSSRPRIELTQRAISGQDCVAILAAHDAYDRDWLSAHASLVFDASNVFTSDRRPNVVPL